MKQLPESKNLTVRFTDEMLEWTDEMIQSKQYANRNEVIKEAITSLFVNEKSEMRAKQKKKTPFKDYVAAIRKEKNLKGGKF